MMLTAIGGQLTLLNIRSSKSTINNTSRIKSTSDNALMIVAASPCWVSRVVRVGISSTTSCVTASQPRVGGLSWLLWLLLYFHYYRRYHSGLLDRDVGPEPCRGSQLYGTIGTAVAYLFPYLLQYLSPSVPQYLLPCEPKLVTRYHLAHHHPSINTHRYIFVLLNVFSLLATQSPVGGEVGVAGEKSKTEELKLGLIRKQ